MMPLSQAMRLAFSLSFALLMGSSPTHAIPLTGITEVRFDAARASKEDNGVFFHNLRIKSNQTTFEDYIEGRYSINHGTGALTLADAKVFPKVGMQVSANTWGVFLAKDVPATIHMYRTPTQPQQYSMDTLHELNGNNGPYYLNLTAGQCLTFHFEYPTDVMDVVFTSPSGVRKLSATAVGGGGNRRTVLHGNLIHETGIHRLDFVPAAASSARIRFRFLNENRRSTINAVHGTLVNTTLRALSGDYAKVKVPLKAGQTALLQHAGTFTAIAEYLATNSRGAVVAAGWQTATITALEQDDYYIFIRPYDKTDTTSDVRVNATMQISNTLSFANWASAHGVSALARNPDQDADGDGVPNLLEYAFGSSPVSPRSVPDMPYRVQNNQLRMNYTIPSYVEGVTVRPETASGNLRTWTQATPSSQTAVPNGTRYEFMSSGSGNGKFLRVRVNKN